jgi:hypothetical protein
MTSIYAIKSSANGVVLDQVSSGGGLAPGYTAMAAVPVGAATALFAYDRAAEKTDVYTLTAGAPWAQLTHARPQLAGPPWDRLTWFTLGNEPYLMTYEREHGTFGFFRVAPDLTVGKPYSFAAPRNTPTKGFSTVAAYPSLGQIVFTGYSVDTGAVANFSLAMVSSSSGVAPPLLAQNLWYHHWAKGWTNFAFFSLGGANFFFKINTAKLNVNIDHMLDNPILGSVEVGSYLQEQLPDALAITSTTTVPWAYGEPHLVTYIAPTGATALYRIHADCQGWTRLDAAVTERHATQLVAYRIGASSHVLLYQDK